MTTCKECNQAFSQYVLFEGEKRKLGNDRRYCTICSPYNGKCGPTAMDADSKKIHLKNNQLKNRYGISIEQFTDLVNQQDNKCAICQSPPPNSYKKNLSVDHCHVTNKVRGLLCTKCNTMLGWFESNRQSIQDYLNG